MDTLRFSITEILSILGIVQCVYVLVYISFRTEKLHHVLLPFMYFLTLGLAFLSDFSAGYIYEITPYFDVLSWAVWSFTTPISVLLIIQMAYISKLPTLPHWSVLLIIPAALSGSMLLAYSSEPSCFQSNVFCDALYDWLKVFGVIAGSLSLLIIWAHKSVFSDIQKQKAGQERYWLILSLILLNIGFITLAAFSKGQSLNETILIRTLFGLSFVYLVSTSLFRLYPNAFHSQSKYKSDVELSSEEREIAKKIMSLLKLEKIYHENTYSRSDLAQELGVAETVISRVINIHFKKSLPQLLNEHRVEDAKSLLLDTQESIKTVAQEVGFNSLPSFNRVFKDITGQSPSEYRLNTIK